MKKNVDIHKNSYDLNELKEKINNLDQQINRLKLIVKTELFDLIVEENELRALYNYQKKLKKEKRIVQKLKGKNYSQKANTGDYLLKQPTHKSNYNKTYIEDEVTKKKLFKEGLFLVHPDMYNNATPEEQEKANLLSVELLQIYQNGTIEEIKNFIFSFKNIKRVKSSEILTEVHSEILYEKYMNEFNKLKEHILYPYTFSENDLNEFIGNLKSYYLDKIDKFKNRTRTK